MFDEVPAQFWLLIAIGAAAYAPARYVIEHVAHSPSSQDITQPPEDLNWRRPGKLALNLVIFAGLLALSGFIFTPAAERFARSAIFVPLLLSLFGAIALFTAARAVVTGRIAPLVRGLNDTYERKTQPKRFWASLAWNALLGCMMLALAPFAYQDQRESQCSNYDDSHSPQEQLSACDQLLAEGAAGDDLVDLLRSRGIAYHDLGEYERAESDYSRAIELYPKDSYSLYNRALVRRRLGNLPGAVEDYDGSLRLRPDNEDGYLNRGLIFLDVGAFDRAAADFTRAHELDPKDQWALADRGIAYALMNERSRAEADFAAVAAADPAHPVLARGRAVLALHAGNPQQAVRHLTTALEHDPSDAWSLKMRANVYWQMGLQDKARDDDDRLARLLEEWEKAGGRN